MVIGNLIPMPYLTLFPGQEPDEKIIMVLRRHGWILFKTIIFYLFLAVLPFFFRYLIARNGVFETDFGPVGFYLVLSLYYFVWTTFFFRSWLDYYLDIWVITSEHIVNIEQKGLFSREISSFQLYRIQDVSAEVRGILATFFHFGNVHVQTAGAESNFVFKQIPEPYTVTKKLMDLVNIKKKNLARTNPVLDKLDNNE